MIRSRAHHISSFVLAGIASVAGAALFALVACALQSLPALAANPATQSHPVWVSEDSTSNMQAPAPSSTRPNPAASMGRGLARPAMMSGNLLTNTGFESGVPGPGAGPGWNSFGNVYTESANLPCIVPLTGNQICKMFGNWSGGFNVSGIFQESGTVPGQKWILSSHSRHCADDAMFGNHIYGGDGNWVIQKLAFFDAYNNELYGADVESTILDGTFPVDTWFTNAPIVGTTPPGAVKVQAFIMYLQPLSDWGAVQIDDVSLQTEYPNWTSDPSVNLPVSTLPGYQYDSAAISDGAGGAIVVWNDGRNFATNDFDIYAQHVLKCGLADPAWPAGGVAVAAAPEPELYPVLASDGSGGALVVWTRGPFGAPVDDIFAQHVLSSGMVDPTWPANGIGVCTALGRQIAPKITSDGAHGAYVAWDDRRSALKRAFVQHLLSSGVDPAWTPNGTPACPSTPGLQSLPDVCGDGSGGVIVAWTDLREFATLGKRELYAQRMSPTGALLWPAAGQPVCRAGGGGRFLNGASSNSVWITSSGDGRGNAIVPDGAGGCFLAWTDDRDFSTLSEDIYGQHLTGSGAVTAGWDPDGVALCRAPGPQTWATMVADGAGGAIATWSEFDAPFLLGRAGVFAQHVKANGVVDGPTDGLMISSAGGYFDLNANDMVSDGSGGAVIAWSDPRNYGNYVSGGYEGYDMFAQRVRTSPSFGVDPGWTADGVLVSAAAGDQFPSVAGGSVSDGAGGMIVAWNDYRNSFDSDVYAQAIGVNGRLHGAPVASITGPASGTVVTINTLVNFTGSFADNAGETHTAQWTFDALPSVPGTVNEATQTVSRSYTFTTPGVYTVKLSVTDACANTGTSTQVGGMDAMVVVYDPNAGFVTGGGWIDSPPGAYSPDPSLTGKANFGFVSKYQKGKNIPVGETEFQFKVAGLNFHSSVYEWMVIAGARAQYRGSGTMNDAGNYGFMLTAIDGQLPGGGGTDKFRMKIFDKTTSVVVYDNQMGMSDDGSPTTALGGGSIVIHVTGGATALTPGGGLIPSPTVEYGLSQNEPNPLRVTSEIRYSLPERSSVRLELYDLAGRRMRSLVDGALEPGSHSATLTRWDARGNPLLEGVYFLRMTAGSLESGARFTTTRKVTVVR